jgi:hypothetical protein
MRLHEYIQKPHRRLQTGACLFIMTLFTKGLPVGFIPEQLFIAPVGDDMVNHCGRGEASYPLAFHT